MLLNNYLVRLTLPSPLEMVLTAKREVSESCLYPLYGLP
jgi:hypothetical protein